MTKIHGRELSEARRHVGSLSQLARIDSFVEADGPARGSRRLRLITGGGLELDIHPDRALDIGQVTIDGIPIAWIEPQGIVAPAFYDPHGAGWLRTFGGGMLTTCGLDTFGAPSIDEGREYGQHGRIGSIPAQMITTSTENGLLVVEAIVRQSSVFGENLTLRRRIESVLGSTEFSITDVVTNEGSTEAAHMIMYHANFGWPLVEKGATFSVPSSSIEPRDVVAASGIDRWSEFEDPTPGRRDEVYLHHFYEGGVTHARLENSRIGVALDIQFDLRQLPWLCEWKFMSEDSYVLGIEPVNTPTMISRAHAREKGVLPVLAPGESVTYELRFSLERTL